VRKLIIILIGAAFVNACVSAATSTWTGGGAPDGNWSNPANWSGGIPDSSAVNALTFSGPTQQSSTNDIPNLTNAIVLANGGFVLNLSQPTTLGPAGGITNQAGSNLVTGALKGSSSTGANGAYYLNVPVGTLNLNATLSDFNAGFKSGAGVLILSGTNDASMYGKTFDIDTISGTADDGVVRVTATAVITNYGIINIRNQGTGRSTLQLDGSAGSVNLDQRPGSTGTRLSFYMRNGVAGTAPHIQNLAGNNSICAANELTAGRMSINKGFADPGTNVIFQSDAGLLTVYGYNSTAANLGSYNFVFSGAGNGVIAATFVDGTGSTTPSRASLIKEGAGTWTLVTNVTFTGQVTVNGGTLALGANGSAVNITSFNVASGAKLDVTAVSGGFSLAAGQTLAGSGSVLGNITTVGGSFIQPGGVNSAGTMTFSNNLVLSAATTNYFDLTTSHAVGGANDLLVVAGNLTPNGAATVIKFFPSITAGTYRLINYSGTKTGTFGPVTFEGGEASAYLDESITGQINLVVTSVIPPANLRWTGGNGATWDVGVSANWSTNASPDINVFSQGNLVTFNDSSTFTNVNITTRVQPGSFTANITNRTYTLSASSGLGMDVGFGGLTKNGPGTLTLDCSNSFVTPLLVNGGTFKVGDNYGNTALSSTTSNIIASGATLDINGWGVGDSPVYVSGTGAGGQGAIISSRNYEPGGLQNSFYTCGFHNVTLMGDTLVNVLASRMHFFAYPTGQGYVKGQGYKLTLQGTNELVLNGYITGLNLNGPAQEPDLGDIEIRTNSTLLVYYLTTLGRLNSNCLVRAGGRLAFWGTGTKAANKNLILEGGSFCVNSSGDNTFNGPILLTNGVANMLVNNGSTFLVNSTITGAGGLATTNYTGTLILAGAAAYTGPTLVSAGTLQVNSSIGAASVVTATSGGTLRGTGIINGPVTIQPGGTNAPGTTTSIGTLTINNSLTIAGDLRFRLDKLNPQTNDYCVVSGALANSGTGTLTVAPANWGDLVVGDKFKLFNKPVANGDALTISPALPPPLAWNNKLAVDGTIEVVVAPPQLDLQVFGTDMFLSWPDAYIGFVLQVQTNQLNVGLSSNWYSIPDSEYTLSAYVPIDPGVPAVFFRLVSP